MSKITFTENSHCLNIEGVAYDGGKLDLPGWKYPIIVDLAGILVMQDQIPLLFGNNKNFIAYVTPKVHHGKICFIGEIKSDRKNLIGGLFKGFSNLDVTIQADVKECDLVYNQRVVNKTNHDGKFYHIQKSVLREICVMPTKGESIKGEVTADGFSLKDWLVIVNSVQENTKTYLEEYIERNNPFSGEAETTANKFEDMAFILNRNAEVLKKIAPLIKKKEQSK